MIEEQFCGCLVDPDGITHAMCREHYWKANHHEAECRRMLDTDLDAVMTSMFGNRKLQRKTEAVVASFAVARNT